MSADTLGWDEVLEKVLEDDRAAALQEFLDGHNGDIDAELADMFGSEGADRDEAFLSSSWPCASNR